MKLKLKLKKRHLPSISMMIIVVIEILIFSTGWGLRVGSPYFDWAHPAAAPLFINAVIGVIFAVAWLAERYDTFRESLKDDGNDSDDSK